MFVAGKIFKAMPERFKRSRTRYENNARICASMCVCMRERGREKEETNLSSQPEGALSKRMAEYLFTLTAVTPRSCQSFIAIRTIPNSNTNGFTPLSSRINRDFHRVWLNEGKLDKSSASRRETHDYLQFFRLEIDTNHLLLIIDIWHFEVLS